MDKPCRALLLEGLGKVLQLGGATSVSLDHVPHEFIHIDKMKDGRWRIIYSSSLIPEIKDLEAIRILRTEEEIMDEKTSPSNTTCQCGICGLSGTECHGHHYSSYILDDPETTINSPGKS